MRMAKAVIGMRRGAREGVMHLSRRLAGNHKASERSLQGKKDESWGEKCDQYM